jgi:hypothetical protein
VVENGDWCEFINFIGPNAISPSGPTGFAGFSTCEIELLYPTKMSSMNMIQIIDKKIKNLSEYIEECENKI